MKSTVVPFLIAANVSPASDGIIIAECLHEAIKQFGPQNLAFAIIETARFDLKQAA